MPKRAAIFRAQNERRVYCCEKGGWPDSGRLFFRGGGRLCPDNGSSENGSRGTWDVQGLPHPLQASALWQCCDFTETFCSPEKRTVHINLDETAVKFFQPLGKGLVAIPKYTTRKRFLKQERRAGLGDRRQAVSYLAFIASDPQVQSLLPQVFVASKRAVSVADARAFEEQRSQDNLFLLLRDSGRLDHKVWQR